MKLHVMNYCCQWKCKSPVLGETSDLWCNAVPYLGMWCPRSTPWYYWCIRLAGETECNAPWRTQVKCCQIIHEVLVFERLDVRAKCMLISLARVRTDCSYEKAVESSWYVSFANPVWIDTVDSFGLSSYYCSVTSCDNAAIAFGMVDALRGLASWYRAYSASVAYSDKEYCCELRNKCVHRYTHGKTRVFKYRKWFTPTTT
jgi:hypothetical protein